MNFSENPISQNRAEEFGYDLWEDYVVPPFYDSLNLTSARKPQVIIGGRGCGKTSLLRYLCHQTQFSVKRNGITEHHLKHIGLYWKMDTQFAKILSKRGVEDDVWERAFEHMATLIVCQELLKSIESVASSSFELFNKEATNSYNFGVLSSFRQDVPEDFQGLKIFLRKEFNRFQTWVGSVRTENSPVFFPKAFISELIREIQEQTPIFKETNYFVYIDEYENLLPNQQLIINTWLKHSEVPLIFNLAMKRNSFINRQTLGNEQLTDIHDFRLHDLESYYGETINFPLFAAEILFLRLYKSDNSSHGPISLNDLRSTDKSVIQNRRDEIYKAKVIQAANTFLPGYSASQMANEVFTDSGLTIRLRSLLTDALKIRGNYNPDDFLIPDFPEAGVIIPSLLSRPKIKIEDLRNEITKLREGSENKFTGNTNWIHNYLVGCLLLIYEPLGRFCPFYSGFDAFCSMSKTNIRHFLELCNKSINNETIMGRSTVDFISQKSQAEAAKHSSTAFLKEVKSFGKNGNALHRFVLRTGTYFKYAHKRRTQSEPEQNHFSIQGNVDSEIQSFLEEAIKWSVLYESRITKQKGGATKLESEDFEYILNPIYAPYFHISYRKKRRIEFTVMEIKTIAFGDLSQFEILLKSAQKNWKLPIEESPINLFSNLN
jgi:hypothetical protein